MRKLVLFLFTGLFSTGLLAQSTNYWSAVNEAALSIDPFAAANSQRPANYELYRLGKEAMKATLALAPLERTVDLSKSPVIVSFPAADGKLESFRIVNAPVMAPELAARYPGIQSYLGVGVNDPAASIRFDISVHGLHASIQYGNKATVYIDPLYQDYYRVIKRGEGIGEAALFACLTENFTAPTVPGHEILPENITDGNLRTYRLAMLSGAEFSNHFIPSALPTLTDSIEAVLAAQNSHITRLNQVYERDVAIRLILVANNDQIIYFDPATDPVANPSSPDPTAIQNAINAEIGSTNYDIGHTQNKSTNNNGNAGCIGCICSATKGRGWTTYSNPSLLEYMVIDYLAHEIGHQFGANHTFSHAIEGAGTNVEPGSGVTIMSYAGIVPGQNVEMHNIDIFSVRSIEQISDHITVGTGSSCTVLVPMGNTAPSITPGADYTIPRSTPFVLTGVATDPNPGDVLKYNFEQIDSRPNTTFPSIPVSNATTGPMFRTYHDYVVAERTFPAIEYILSGDNGFQWEVLPSVGRNLNFRFIVKDNHPGGGTTQSDDVVITVSGTAGPFLISSQNSAVAYAPGSSQTVTWSVNSTNIAPVSCANVRILFSADGGATFPYVLAASTPNDGSQSVTLPAITTSTGRIKVEAVSNIFFDINNDNILLSSTLPVELLSFSGYKDALVNKLRWTTVMEQDNLGFEVQRSSDGIDYRVIGFVNTQAPDGNSHSKLDYGFVDASPSWSRQYYRLRQVDRDGTAQFSKIVLISDKLLASPDVRLYPSPAKTVVNVLIQAPAAGQLTIQVTDITGRIVMQRPAMVGAGSNTIPMPVSQLINGTYLVKIVPAGANPAAGNEMTVGKFVKQD